MYLCAYIDTYMQTYTYTVLPSSRTNKHADPFSAPTASVKIEPHQETNLHWNKRYSYRQRHPTAWFRKKNIFPATQLKRFMDAKRGMSSYYVAHNSVGMLSNARRQTWDAVRVTRASPHDLCYSFKRHFIQASSVRPAHHQCGPRKQRRTCLHVFVSTD